MGTFVDGFYRSLLVNAALVLVPAAIICGLLAWGNRWEADRRRARAECMEALCPVDMTEPKFLAGECVCLPLGPWAEEHGR